ncbi:MAG: hypothetical protein R3261_08485 [Alphaproteobacteria bacterium]|nr:hypothetical protein [Alphaproteobacteria bacterium]
MAMIVKRMEEDQEQNEKMSKSAEVKKSLSDYTEEELENMPEEEREELEREARIQAKFERDKQLEELRFGLREIQGRIKQMLEMQKNMGLFPDVDGKHAMSLCISALARHNDEKAIRTALNACLAYLKAHKEREENEIKKAEEAKKKQENENAKPKKGLFRR